MTNVFNFVSVDMKQGLGMKANGTKTGTDNSSGLFARVLSSEEGKDSAGPAVNQDEGNQLLAGLMAVMPAISIAPDTAVAAGSQAVEGIAAAAVSGSAQAGPVLAAAALPTPAEAVNPSVMPEKQDKVQVEAIPGNMAMQPVLEPTIDTPLIKSDIAPKNAVVEAAQSLVPGNTALDTSQQQNAIKTVEKTVNTADLAALPGSKQPVMPAAEVPAKAADTVETLQGMPAGSAVAKQQQSDTVAVQPQGEVTTAPKAEEAKAPVYQSERGTMPVNTAVQDTVPIPRELSDTASARRDAASAAVVIKPVSQVQAALARMPLTTDNTGADKKQLMNGTLNQPVLNQASSEMQPQVKAMAISSSLPAGMKGERAVSSEAVIPKMTVASMLTADKPASQNSTANKIADYAPLQAQAQLRMQKTLTGTDSEAAQGGFVQQTAGENAVMQPELPANVLQAKSTDMPAVVLPNTAADNAQPAVSSAETAAVSVTAVNRPTDSKPRFSGNKNSTADEQQVAQEETPVTVKTANDKVKPLQMAQLSSESPDSQPAAVSSSIKGENQPAANDNQTVNFSAVLNQHVSKPEHHVQSAAAPAPATVDTYNIAGQIVEKAQLVNGINNTEMVIKLRPEHLGELTLKVTVENGLVSASFHSDNPEVRTVIESSLYQLKQEMLSQGLKLDSVGVYAGLGQFLSNGQQQGANQQQFGGKAASKKKTEDFMEIMEVTESASRSGETSGVDYRA